MKIYSVPVVATAFVLLTSAAACGKSPIGPSPVPIDDNTGTTTLTLTGRVLDATMGDDTGVADATVTVSRDTFSTSATTDVDGSFSFGGLDAGEYMLSISRPGYLEATQAVQLESDQSVTCFLDRESDSTAPIPERKGRFVVGKKGGQVRR